MSKILQVIDKLYKIVEFEVLPERLSVNLFKEYPGVLEPSLLYEIPSSLTKLSVPLKVSAVFAVVALLKHKFEGISDEDYYLKISAALLQLVGSFLNFFVEKSLSPSFNAHDELFTKTVGTSLAVVIPLRKRSDELGFELMNRYSPQILTLLTCKRLRFSVRREATLLYAEEIAQCDGNTLKRIIQTQSNLLSELVQWIPLCGDIQLQEALLMIAISFSLATEEKVPIIKKWLLNPRFDPAIECFTLNNFKTNIRISLNYINCWAEQPTVYTLSCLQCFGDDRIPIKKPEDKEFKELWVDFNTNTKSISVNSSFGHLHLILYFDNFQHLDLFSSSSLFEKDTEEYKLNIKFKQKVPVTSQGQSYEFSGLTFIFQHSSVLTKLVNNFLVSYFPNLINLANMMGFKSPNEPGRDSKPPLKSPGAKDYFSRKSMELKMQCRPFIDSNDHLSKYKNLDPDVKYSAKSDNSKGEAKAGTSSLRNQSEKPSNSVSSHSSSFITDYARVSSNRTNKTPNILNESWKSNSSLFKGFSEVLLARDKENEGLGKLSYYNLSFDQRKKDPSTLVSKDVLPENIDTSITPYPNSEDEDDEYVQELRSETVKEHSFVDFTHKSFSKTVQKDREVEAARTFSPALDEGSNHSNLSDLCPNMANYVALQRISENFDMIPMPSYNSDNSIVDDSQPNRCDKVVLPKRSCESLRGSSENVLSNDKISPTQLSSMSDSPGFFVTNRNNQLTKLVDLSKKLSDNNSSGKISPVVEYSSEKIGLHERSSKKNVLKPLLESSETKVGNVSSVKCDRLKSIDCDETSHKKLKETVKKRTIAFDKPCDLKKKMQDLKHAAKFPALIGDDYSENTSLITSENASCANDRVALLPECDNVLNNKKVIVSHVSEQSSTVSLGRMRNEEENLLEDPSSHKKTIDISEKIDLHEITGEHLNQSLDVPNKKKSGEIKQRRNANYGCNSLSDFSQPLAKVITPSNDQVQRKPKSSLFTLSQSSAFKPAYPAPKGLSDTEALSGTTMLDKGVYARASSKSVSSYNQMPSTSSALTKPVMKRTIDTKLDGEKIKTGDQPVKKSKNLDKVVNNIKHLGLIRPVVKVDNKEIDLQTSKIFQPITCAPIAQIEVMPKGFSTRSTDGSSKMELEQILYHCSQADVNKGNVGAPGRRKDTPFVYRSNSSFIDRNVKVVKDSLPLGENSINLFSELSVGVVSSCKISNSGSTVDKFGTFKHDSSRLTVPASSGSDSSFLSPPINLEGSQPLNFTRLINTDANNNTLLDKKSLSQVCSPTVLPVTKTSKTYIRKPVSKPNHYWFQTINTKPNMCPTSNMKKKKLFHLPSNYQESVTSDDGGFKVNPSSDLKKSRKSSRLKVQKISSQLHTIEEPPGSLENESGPLIVDEETVCRDVGSNRRSFRSRKPINYKEVSDTETEKSANKETGRSTSAVSEKSMIKNLILKNSQNDSGAEEHNTNLFRSKIIKTFEVTTQNKDFVINKNIEKSKSKEVGVNKNYINKAEDTYEVRIKDNVNTQQSYRENVISEDRKGKPNTDIFDFDNDLPDSPEKNKRRPNTRRGVNRFNKGREHNKMQSTRNRNIYSNLKRTYENSQKEKLKKGKINEKSADPVVNMVEDNSNRTSHTGSHVMETVTVKALVHHPPQKEQCEKSRSIPSTAVNVQRVYVEENIIDLCSEPEEDTNPLPHEVNNEQENRTAILQSLMKSLKEHIDGINNDFNKLSTMLNH